MLVLEYKLRGKPSQYQAIDEAIRTVQFVRNKCLRYWEENKGEGQKDIYRYTTLVNRLANGLGLLFLGSLTIARTKSLVKKDILNTLNVLILLS
ncbi:MAG: hypothetical protein RLZZ143_3791 [Cyanobacteriota bacterium]